MPINVSYTPYGAVGKLAAAGGRAQQAVRDQQYDEQEEAQNRSIFANAELQTQRLQSAAVLQEQELAYRTATQEKDLIFQQEQLSNRFVQEAMNRDAQMYAARQQREIQEAAIKSNFELNQQKVEYNKQQQELQNIAKEKAFSLQVAAENRLQQSALADIERSKSLNMLGLEKLNIGRTRKSDNLAMIDRLLAEGNITPVGYVEAKMEIEAGRTPTLDKGMTMNQIANMDFKSKKNQRAMTEWEEAGLTNAQIKLFTDKVSDIADLGFLNPFATGGRLWDRGLADLEDRYLEYYNTISYQSLSEAQRKQSDTFWDSHMKDKDEDNWDTNSPTIKSLRNVMLRTDRAKAMFSKETGPVVQQNAAQPQASAGTNIQPAFSTQTLADFSNMVKTKRGIK